MPRSTKGTARPSAKEAARITSRLRGGSAARDDTDEPARVAR